MKGCWINFWFYFWVSISIILIFLPNIWLFQNDYSSHLVSSTNENIVLQSRYGHLHFRSLSILQKLLMVKGLPTLSEQTNPCESCILRKHQRDNFPKASYRAKEHLELVHIELCIPMQNKSIGGSIDFLKFIKDR